MWNCAVGEGQKSIEDLMEKNLHCLRQTVSGVMELTILLTGLRRKDEVW